VTIRAVIRNVKECRVLDLETVRSRFPALARTGPDGEPLVHADAPGGTQVLGSVIEAIGDYLTTSNANAHGAFTASRRTDEICSDGRSKVASLFGGEHDGVVFGPNMTTLTFHVARALAARLGPGDEIVTTRLDHDANVAPWLMTAEISGAQVRFVEVADDATIDPASITRAVTDRTRLVAFPAASNAFGTLVDPAPFVAAARAVGAITFCDAVHAAPHVALDRRDAGIDVLACSPYKFFGPHAGLLVADPEVLASLNPDKVRPSPDTGPERWQTGTANFEAIAGIGPAVDHLTEIGMKAVREHETQLTRRFMDGLASLSSVHLHGTTDPDRRTPTFAVTVDGATPEEVTRSLADRGVLTWAGHYYALEPMRALGLLHRGGAVRIGFVHYHRPEDVDRVLAELERL
jgi:cysteine desulfurase family protein (TIGR01976 family)